MIRVLMTGASNIGKAGVATISFRLGQAMDGEKVSISYLAQHGVSDEKYKSLSEAKGGKIYEMPVSERKTGKFMKYFKVANWIGSVAKDNVFDVVHINADTAYLAAEYIWIFKRCGIHKLVVHSHSTMVDDNNSIRRTIKVFFHKMCRSYVRKNASLKLACSSHAAAWMFADCAAKVIPNGIDVERFQFNPVVREEYRRKMGLNGQFVIACVGRLAFQKKTHFSVDIFKIIMNVIPDSCLLLVGDGELREEIEQKIKREGLSGKVLLLGNRDDVPALLAASDAFLLPSRFEGLGMVYIEAQASGLPVFASDRVPEEAFLTDSIYRISLEAPAEEWAEQIISHKDDGHKDQVSSIRASNFDIYSAARLLQREYEKIMKE